VTAAIAAVFVLVGAVPRLLLAADALPDALRPFIWSDVLHTWERGMSGGRVPYWDTYFEYPPLVGYASALFSWLAPSAVAYVAMWTAVQAAAAAIVAAVLGRRPLVAWSFAPQLALLGPVNFDLVTIAALVLAVRFGRAHAPMRSAAAIAVGTAAKLFPAVALPVVLIREAAGRRMRAAATALAVFAVLVAAAYAPSALAPFSSLESITRYAARIPANFDSFWGLPAAAVAWTGLDPSRPILVITLAGLVISYAAVVLPAALRARDVAVPIALAVLTLLLWTRLYSPQFSLWALPFFALLPLDRRALTLLIAADLLVFATVYPLTLREWAADDPVRVALFAVLAAAVVVRHLALLLAWLSARRLAGRGWKGAPGAGPNGPRVKGPLRQLRAATTP